jgi:hypothetical protein
MVKKTAKMNTGATNATGYPGLTGTYLLGGARGNTNDRMDPTSRLTVPPGGPTIPTEGVIDGPNNTSLQTDNDVKE